ncbi:MAG: metal ABC transporter permease [Trebonia sp.]
MIFVGVLSDPSLARAFIAGTLIAAAAGLVGYFVVLRGQVFAGDALSHVAFTGALAALVAGIDLRIGLFVACVGFGVGMAGLGRHGRPDDVVIGSTFAWILGVGVALLAVYTVSGGGGGVAGPTVLFGSIFGMSTGEVVVASSVAVGLILSVSAMARPLLFASVDPDVAAARGVPVRSLGVAFLALVGVTAGEATQAVGALLLLGLLAAPAGAAHRLTARPSMGLILAPALAVAAVWIGLSLSYAVASLPPSFTIVSSAAAIYALAAARARLSRSNANG